ncbi:MAG: DUF3047 domain-containing protein [Candidatus Omnitrophica bacterium]|nr:DUF3047 domain-containing protein [Candidatus Omnitrophota bacterium]
MSKNRHDPSGISGSPFKRIDPKPVSAFPWKRWLKGLLFVSAAGFILIILLQEFISRVSLPGSGGARDTKPAEVIDFRFDSPSAMEGWKTYVFNNKSRYVVEADSEAEWALHATSQNAYSTIFKVVNVPLETKPVLAWEWRAIKFPTGKKNLSLDAKGENDYAIRICAIFARNNPLMTDVIQYIWDDYFPVGTHARSPYSKNVRMLVVRSGTPPASEKWFLEKRDLRKDYEMLFGKMRYRSLKSIGITTNSDDTKTMSEAYVRRIWIESTQPKPVRKNWRKVRQYSKEIWRTITAPFKHVRMDRIRLKQVRLKVPFLKKEHDVSSPSVDLSTSGPSDDAPF